MGSIVVSDVAHHLPYAMFGANALSHEASASQTTYRSDPLRPSHPEPSNPSLRTGLVDTPMADATSRTATSALPPPPSQQRASLLLDPTGQLAQPPPRSPRLYGHGAQDLYDAQTNHLSYSHPRAATSSASSSVQHSPARSNTFQASPAPRSPVRIKVKSLSHIQSFVVDELNPLSRTRASGPDRRDSFDASPQYEISEMPVTDIIEMVAGLLTKITTTNDRQHEHLHRQIPPPDGTAHLSQQTTSVLAFHGKNIPSISILSYLSRIHKYCPTTYEVFLSLLVYFDRMTERVNSGPLQSLRQANQQAMERQTGGTSDISRHSSVSSPALAQESPNVVTRVQAATPPPSGSLGKPSEPPPSPPVLISLDSDRYNFSHFFVVDSFNIHRLIIAGVTCASKFFSDIFYTNSRYAKVCAFLTFQSFRAC